MTETIISKNSVPIRLTDERWVHITGIPALLFFQEGKVVDTVVGAVPKRVLQQHVDSVVSHV